MTIAIAHDASRFTRSQMPGGFSAVTTTSPSVTPSYVAFVSFDVDETMPAFSSMSEIRFCSWRCLTTALTGGLPVRLSAG